MKNITYSTALKEAIRILEVKQATEEALLKEQFKITFENLKPVNLIKNTLKDWTADPNFKGNLMNTVLSVMAGYLSKKAVVGKTHNPIKQILGTFLQMGVTKVVSKNTDEIKSAAQKLMNLFSKKNSQAN